MHDGLEPTWRHVTDALATILGGMTIVAEDCGAIAGIDVEPFFRLRSLGARARGRAAVDDIVDEQSGDLIVPDGRFIDKEMSARLGAADLSSVWVRSPSTCLAHGGICANCFGLDPTSGEPLPEGHTIGRDAVEAIRTPRSVKVQPLPGFVMGEQPVEVRSESAGTVRYGALPPGVELTPARDHFGSGQEPALRLVDPHEADGTFMLTVEPGGEQHRPRNEALIVVQDGEPVRAGALLYRQRAGYRRLRLPEEFGPVARLFEGLPADANEPLAVLSPTDGTVTIERRTEGEATVTVVHESGHECSIPVTGDEAIARIYVRSGEPVIAGDMLLEGARDYSAIREICGAEKCLAIWLEDVLARLVPVGWDIDDRYLELVFREMARDPRRLLGVSEVRSSHSQ